MNVVLLVGRLGQNPELKGKEGSTPMARFSIATKARYKTREGEWKDRTTWHNCQIWGKRATSVAEHFSSGDLVSLEGHISVNEYNDKTYVNIVADELVRLAKKGDGGGEPRQRSQERPEDQPESESDTPLFDPNDPAQTSPPDDDDIPF